MDNVLSVDVEDYFHVEAFASTIPPEDWDKFTPRVERNVGRVLQLLETYNTRGTFFVLGWVARRFPDLIGRIAAAGHEIGCHGYAHRRLHRQTPEQFRQDLRMARQCIEDVTQVPVSAYRAPSFSIVSGTLWAFDILAEEGFRFDSSIFPVRHDLYGIPGGRRFPHWRNASNGASIFEFPLSTIRIGSRNVGVCGGGYLRFSPYWFTRWALREINTREAQPVIVYFHPWELDPDQPRIRAGLRSRLRHYTNLSTMEYKIERLLREFRFSTLSEVCGRLDSYRSGATTPKKEECGLLEAV